MPPDPPPAAKLLPMLFGRTTTQLVALVARLKIPDLVDGQTPVADLARARDLHEPTLYRVLRLLAAIGIFEESPGRLFALTPLGALLRSDAKGSLREFAVFNGSPWVNGAYGNLEHSLRTGSPAFVGAFGQDMFAYLAGHPKDAAVFNGAMTSMSRDGAPAICDAYDFAGVRSVVDVGGGHGFLLSTILRAHPALRGVLFDLPAVVDGARAQLAADGVAERCEVVAGDFFRAVPAGADRYLLKFIIHDWDDERAIQILRKCRDAMDPDGRVIVAEIVVEPGNVMALLRDVQMLALTAGRERERAEFASLFAAAGLELVRVLPTRSSVSLVEARRV